MNKRLSVYDEPPGNLVHMSGKGNTYHYGPCDEAYADPLCGKQLPDSQPCGAPSEEYAPNAKLCRPCERAALEQENQ